MLSCFRNVIGWQTAAFGFIAVVSGLVQAQSCAALTNEGCVRVEVTCKDPSAPRSQSAGPEKMSASNKTPANTVSSGNECSPSVSLINLTQKRPYRVFLSLPGVYWRAQLPSGVYTVNVESSGAYGPPQQKFDVRVFIGDIAKPAPKRFELLKSGKPSIAGQVVDSNDHSLHGVSVIAINEASGVSRQTTTDEYGDYRFADLPAGDYIVTALWGYGSGDGASSVQVALGGGEVVAPAIKLANVAGPAQDTAPVYGPRVAVMVGLSDAARRGNFNEQQLRALPLGGASYMRSFDELPLLVAGVAPPPFTPGARGPGVGFGVGTAGQFSVNGQRARSNNFSVDGSDNNDPDVGVRRQGFVALVPQSIESVKDISIVTSLWDAELGRNAGSQINVVTDYGGSEFHGQIYGFFTDSRLKARDFFDYTGGAAGGKDPFTRTQAGAVIGGPLIGKNSFFFGSFEREKINASTEQHFSTPAAEERKFRDSPFAVPVFASEQNIEGVPQTFSDGLTPLGKNVLSLYPLPNHPSGPFGKNTFTRILPADGDGKVLSFKVTHHFPSDHTLNARYNFSDDNRVLPSVNRAINSTLDSKTRAQNLSLIFDSVAPGAIFNQARFSFGRTRLGFLERAGSPFIFESRSRETVTIPPGTPNIAPGSFPFPSQTGPIGELIIEPFSPVGVGVFHFPQRRVSNTFQVADTLSWARGSHSIKLGGAIRRYQFNNAMDRLYRPQVVYGGALVARTELMRAASSETPFAPYRPQVISGVQLASLGVASSVLQTITTGQPDSTVGLRFNEYHVFANDNWRVRPNLTLDYGLRYEYNSVPHSVDKRIERALTLENLPALGNSRFNASDRANKFNAAVNAYRQALGGRNRIYDQDRNNFGPHVGFAWTPGELNLTAVRGGYGVYFDTILGAVVTQSRNVFPNEIPINVDPSFLQFDVYGLNNPATLQITTLPGNPPILTNPVSLFRSGSCNQFGACNQLGGTPDDFVALVGLLFLQNPKGGLAFTLPEKNLRAPYAQSWHLTIEHELFSNFLFSAGYVGARGTKLTRLTTPNFGPLVTPFIPVISAIRAPLRSGQSISYPAPVIFNLLTGGALRRRPTEDLGAYQVYENSASSTYHALQFEARKRYGHNIQFTTAYTWSHAIDDVSDVFVIAGAPILPQDSSNLRSERASANFDIRHRFASSLIWDLPFRSQARGARLLFDAWQISAIFQAQTGQPFTLNVPFDANFDGNLTDRPSTTDGLVIFNGHGRHRVSATKPLESYFVLGKDGVVGRNTLRGDSFINLDLALTKTFRFTETSNLAFRAEFFNLFNRANFGLPVRILDAPAFGSAVDTVNPARMIQFALKYSF